ncbi:hypothetical protein AA14337_1295 [Acetobacter malorum DSM 14337]|uniref:Uncharacterized protein n=1 Tax=Acetobacter malorum DSM 14337 TaxID=1307910 RepID=A0ABQ0PSG9_9PROT|nr:hypothetical protein AA14337_1295 [Acetobacter malorum DSM 14337]
MQGELKVSRNTKISILFIFFNATLIFCISFFDGYTRSQYFTLENRILLLGVIFSNIIYFKKLSSQ